MAEPRLYIPSSAKYIYSQIKVRAKKLMLKSPVILGPAVENMKVITGIVDLFAHGELALLGGENFAHGMRVKKQHLADYVQEEMESIELDKMHVEISKNSGNGYLIKI